MLDARHPGREALYAHAEAAVRHRPETPQVEIPLEGFTREIMFRQATLQQGQIVNSLAPADNFAVAFGRQNIRAQRKLRPLVVGLKVEGFNLPSDSGPLLPGDQNPASEASRQRFRNRRPIESRCPSIEESEPLGRRTSGGTAL